MAKKNSPGCKCCVGVGLLAAPRASTVQRLGPRIVRPPRLTKAGNGTLILSSISLFGSGTVAVGHDVERRKLLVQRANGSVWTLDADGTNPAELWTVSSQAAGKLLHWVKYHHQWGFASAKDQSVQVMAFDASGQIVRGPFPHPTGNFGGLTSATVDNHCVDSAGNLYWTANNTGAPSSFLRNNVGYARAPVPGGNITACCHDGANAYATGSAAFGSPAYGILLLNPNNTSQPTVAIAQTSLPIPNSATTTHLIWDAKHQTMEGTATQGGSDKGGFRVSLDLSTNLWLSDDYFYGDFQDLAGHTIASL